MNLTEILKKIAAGEKITVAEKTFIQANKELLDDAQVEAVDAAETEAETEAEAEVEAPKEAEEKSMDDMINKALAKRIDEMTTAIAKKFADGVDSARAKAFTNVKKVEKTTDEPTRNFMKALFNNDTTELKAISGLSTGAGGYLIPEELRAEILRVAETQYGLARREMRYLPFSGPGNSRQIPALASSVSVSWTDEGSAKQSTRPTFDIVTQTLKKLAAIVPMTEEILEDANINLTALVAELFAEAVAKEEDLQFFNGDGSVWTGILNNGDVNVVNLTSTNPAAVTAEDLLAMVDATPSGALDGAKFYMHRSVFSKIRTLREGSGGDGAFIVQKPTDASAPASMWGYPIELSDAFPAVTETGNDQPFVLFGNLKKAAIFGDKQQLRVKLLDQATVNNTANNGTINLAQNDMVAVRIVERVGFVLALPQAVTVLATESAGS